MEYDWILNEAEKIEEKIVSHRRYLHQNAEVGFSLEKTKAYVVGILMNYLKVRMAMKKLQKDMKIHNSAKFAPLLAAVLSFILFLPSKSYHAIYTTNI